jgi:hypothetical protein
MFGCLSIKTHTFQLRALSLMLNAAMQARAMAHSFPLAVLPKENLSLNYLLLSFSSGFLDQVDGFPSMELLRISK